MELDDALAYVRANRFGVLTTQKRDGRPQLSNIVYAIDDDNTVRISVTDGRAKTKNLRRDPRASLYVCQENFWAYVVLDGDAELSPVATDPNDETVEQLVDLYRRLQGDHPNWDEYRAAMVNDGRLLVRFTPTHAYGMLPAG
jgi:PPOX class probable F420-dependent enzyme